MLFRSGVVKHLPYPDLVTGWGGEHGRKGPSLVIHNQRLRAKLGWIWLELHYPKASFERCLREHQGKWIEALAPRPSRSDATTYWLSDEGAIHDECIQRNERPA